MKKGAGGCTENGQLHTVSQVKIRPTRRRIHVEVSVNEATDPAQDSGSESRAELASSSFALKDAKSMEPALLIPEQASICWRSQVTEA